MSKIARSARGELVDFELLAIKAQLAASPVPKKVEQRKAAIDAKDGVKTDVTPDINVAALQPPSPTGRQLKRK